jgi:murein L,D-transpeptidase YcbB/YkuD
MYTGNEKQLIEATGQFKTYDGKSYIDSDQKLKVGDILFKIGHSAVVVKVQYIISRYIKYQEGQPIMSGEDVAKIQARLNKLDKVELDCDGEYGPKTAAEVVRFQAKKKLTTDGIIGPKTVKALGFYWEG